MQVCATFSGDFLAVAVSHCCRAPPPVQEEDDASRCHSGIQHAPTHTHTHAETQSVCVYVRVAHTFLLFVYGCRHNTAPSRPLPMLQLKAVRIRSAEVIHFPNDLGAFLFTAAVPLIRIYFVSMNSRL